MNDDELAGSKRSQTPAPSLRIVVVGPCASGKSSLVESLRSLGYDARVSAQEHSAIPSLWQRMNPDVVIALEADISAVRARRGDDWPEWLHDIQVQRLQEAAAAADLTIDTTDLDPNLVSGRVLEFLAARAGEQSSIRREPSPRVVHRRAADAGGQQ